MCQSLFFNKVAGLRLSPARVLFDSCSQLSYVRPELKRKLNLASIKQRDISVQTFGKIDSRDSLKQVELCVFTGILCSRDLERENQGL